MELTATRKVDPLRITGAFDLTTEDLQKVFTPDAPPEVQALFYHIFNDPAWMAKKMSEQFLLLADVSGRIEAVNEAAATVMGGTLSAPQPK